MDSRIKQGHIIYVLMLASALVSILSGIVVMAGWHAHDQWLLQISPSHRPMQYNSALAFVLLGLGFIACLREKRALALIFGSVVAMFGGLCVIQYGAGIDLGVDMHFMHSSMTAMAPFLGRPALNTAMAFLLLGLSLALVLEKKNKWTSLIPQVLLVIVMALSTAACLGYIAHIEAAYGWGAFTRMALHTALVSLILSLGLLTFSLEKSRTPSVPIPWSLPYLNAIGMSLLAILMWQAYSTWEDERIIAASQREVEVVRDYLVAEIGDSTRSLERIAHQLSRGVTRKFWEEDTRLYIQNEPSYVGIGWVDDSRIVRWRNARDPLQSQAATSLNDGGERSRAFAMARQTGEVQITGHVTLRSGGEGFLIIAPVKGGRGGFVVAGFHYDTFLKKILERQLNAGFVVTIGDEKETIFSANTQNAKAGGMAKALKVEFSGTSWFLDVEVPKAYISVSHSYLPLLILILGVMFAIVTSLAIFFFRKTSLQNAALEKSLDEKNKAIRSRELVLSIVSHDLKNPVVAVDMTVQLMAKRVSDPETLESIERIGHYTHSMQRMIGDLLDFGKIQADTFSVKTSPQFVSRIVDAAMEGLLPRIASKRIQLTVDVASDLPMVEADLDRVVQVLWNLIGNAIKFTPENGKISLAVKKMGEGVQFTVSDNGPGMSRDELPKVFDQFWQSKKTAALGTGLGLSIAKGIITAHRGKIWADAAEGEGCSFHFMLKESTKPLEAVMDQTQPHDHLKGVRVLLVDDSPEIRRYLRLMLENAGAIVQESGSVQEALEQISAKLPDILLTDIEMPDGDGYDLLKEVRRMAQAKGFHFPIGALSAHSSEVEKLKMHDAGFDVQLSKPIAYAQLVTSLEKLIETRIH